MTGHAGCNEDEGGCQDKISQSRGEWSAFWMQAEGSYSYARLNIPNSTHLQWINRVAETERVVDEVWIVKGEARKDVRSEYNSDTVKEYM